MYAIKDRNSSGELIQRRKNITTEIIAGPMGMIQSTHTHCRNAQDQWFDTRRRLRDVTQLGYHKTIRHVYGLKDKREAGERITNILY